MKTHAFRLTRGQDLLLSIQTYASEQHLKAAAIVSGVGCVLAARLRDAGGVNIHEFSERMEIVSLTGTVSEVRTHLHGAFSREDLSVLGGHLVSGCIVNTTAEIVLLSMDDITFGTEFDPESGYHELTITSIEP